MSKAGFRKSAYLIDASIYIFRAWFSVPDTMRGENGMPVNAVYGFCRFLTEFAERSRATHVAIAFDESLAQSFRNEIYPAYKTNRELPPAALQSQFELCRRLAEAAGFFCISSDRYEADDLIATIAAELRPANYQSIIVSGDKDLAQILRVDDVWWDFARDRKLDRHAVLDKFGVPPEAIQDFLGLCGDAVDNIPGVPGIGPKTASALLTEFGSVETLYDSLPKVSSLPIRGAKTLATKLSAHAEQAKLSKTLATVAYDAPIEVDEYKLARRSAERARLAELGQIMGGRGDGLFERLIDAALRIGEFS